MEEYPRVRLSDLCDSVEYGFTASAHKEPVGPRFLRITDIVPEQLDWASVPFCEIKDAKLEKYRLRDGDIVVARTGATTGWAKYVKQPPNAVFASYLVRLRTSPSVDSRFIGFVVESSAYKAFVQRQMGGAAQPNANAKVLSSFRVPLPPLPIQRQIARILSGYEDLIANTLRRIRILEQLAQSLYREWFVEFRFPEHEKAQFVDSALGRIPEGWDLRVVADCVDINPSVQVGREGEKPFVPMSSLSNDSMLISDVESRSGNSGAKFQNGDTLFARITPCLENGKTAFVQFLKSDQAVAFGSTEFIVLRSRTVTPEYVYCLARSESFRNTAIKSMSGATGRQRVQEKCFDAFRIAEPSKLALSQFTDIVRPSFKLIHQLHQQVVNLRRTRDLLLPRLLSGNCL